MASVSFAEFVLDKLLSIPSKMKDYSFNQGSSLCLMGGTPGIMPQLPGELLDDLIENGLIGLDFNSYDCVPKTKTDYPLMKNLGYKSLAPKISNFSPHLFSVVNDSIRFLKQSDILFSTPNTLNLTNMLSEIPVVKPKLIEENFVKLKSCVKEATPIEKSVQPTVKMSVTVKECTVKNRPDVANKVNVPNCVTLNLELANRKTKELQKRSKNRKRRQKKGQRSDASSAEVACDKKVPGSKNSSQLCYSKNSKSDSQFVFTVKQHVQNAQSLTSQFVISVSGLSDDDSDSWDSCSASDILTDTADFEFSGLVVADLSSPQSCFLSPHSFDVKCSILSYSKEEADEVAKLESVLLQANKKWNELTKGVTVEPKQPTKVSFASDDKLVEVLPTDICDRKGEWELYAVERLRFKRRIDEMDKIISPCLSSKHRLSIYNKRILPEL